MEQSKFYQIKNVTECEYTLVGCDGSVITRPIQEVDKIASAFTIQDAKPGDVLASELCESIILFRGIKNDNIDFYCDYDFSKIDIPGDRFAVNNGQHYGNIEDSEDFHPATQEQRDLLFQKMKDAGYEWDAKKKQLAHSSKTKKSDQEELTKFEMSLKNVLEETLECEDTHNLKADAELLLSIARQQIVEEDFHNSNKPETFDEKIRRGMNAFAYLYLEPLKVTDSNIGITITMAQLYECARHFYKGGSKNARKQFIEEACEWLRENIYHRVYEQGDRLGFPTAEFIKDFRKALEKGGKDD